MDSVELSMNSLVGLTEPRTMRLKGMIKGKEVVVLVNCRATHNFIAVVLVD